MSWDEVFGKPGRDSEVVVGPAAHTGEARSEFSGVGTPTSWEVTLEDVEMSPGQAQAWARMDGYAIVRVYAEILAQLLGGSLEWNTHRNMKTGQERHEVLWKGPEVEL